MGRHSLRGYAVTLVAVAGFACGSTAGGGNGATDAGGTAGGTNGEGGGAGSVTDAGPHQDMLSDDTTPPEVFFRAPFDGTTVSGVVEVQADATDDGGVAQVVFALDGVDQATIAEMPFTWTWDTAGLVPGPYLLSARATDAAGNAATAVIQVEVAGNCLADGNCPPADVRIITPVEGAVVCGELSIEAAASDDDLARIELSVDDRPVGVAERAPYAVLWNTRSVDNGPHVITAVAVDAANQRAFARASVEVRNVAGEPCDNVPNVRIVDPADGTYLNGDVFLEAQASDNGVVVSVEFALDNGRLALLDSVPWQTVWESDLFDEGVHTIKATATDDADQTASTQILVTLDRTPPTVEILAPAFGEAFADRVPYTFDPVDNFAIDRVEVFLNGTLVETLAQGPWTGEVDTTGIASGDAELAAVVYDRVGASQRASTQIRIDRAPSVEIRSPGDGSALEGPTEVRVTANDDVGVEWIELYVDGAPFDREAGSEARFQWEPEYARREHTLRALVTDTAGQTASHEIAVRVDHPFEVVIASPFDGEAVSGTVAIQAETRDDDGQTQRVDFLVDGELAGSAARAPFAFDLDTTAFPDGERRLSIHAVSDNGSEGDHAITVTVGNCDRDADGYVDDNGACGGTDCDDDDWGTHPDATDDVGDGIDSNCDGVDGEPGQDADGDGASDLVDNCRTDPNPDQVDLDADGVGDACDLDDDGDAVSDWRDNCTGTPNVNQRDADGDGTGDVCNGDVDGDGVADPVDNCPRVANPAQVVGSCGLRFRSVTYGRDVRGLAIGEQGLVAATAGGLFEVLPDGTSGRTSADGLADNRLNAVFVDSHGRRWAVSDDAVSVVRPDGFAFRMASLGADGGPQGRQLRSVVVDGDDVVYVSSDAGLNVHADGVWTLLTRPDLPSVDVRGLWLSPANEVWAATASGAARLVNGAVTRTVRALPGIGDTLNAVSGEADGTVWLLGDNGAARLAVGGGDVPRAVYTGFAAYAFTVGPNGNRYLGTADGLRRIDADGRLFPAGDALLPAPEVRALAGAPAGEIGQPIWAGTAEGLIQLEGYFATFRPAADTFVRPCVTTATRIGSLLWIGTDSGLYVMDAAGAYRRLDRVTPGNLINVIRVIGDTVWVGTDAGIGLLGTDATPQRQLTAANGIPAAPISDIVAGNNDQVWIASDGNGIARRNADGTFTPFTRETAGNNFLSNQVKAVAHDGNTLWIGTEDQGVTVFNEGTQTFQFPVANQGGQLPDPRVQDIVVGEGKVYVATPQGVAVRRPDGSWITLRRATGGWPNSAGSDFVRALAFDGEGLWVTLADNARNPTGVLLRRLGIDPLPEGSEGGETVRVYSAESAGLVASRGRTGTSLEWTGTELFASWCGADDDVGGFSVLEGRGVVVRDASAGLGLPAGDGAAALTLGPNGQPLFTASREAAMPLAIGLRPAEPVQHSPFFLPPSVTGVLRKCAPAPGTGELWCVISGVGVGRRLDDEQWVVLDEERVPGMGRVRDLAVDGPQSVWAATPTGVIRLDQGNPRFYNVAATNGGLPSDDVHAVATGPGGKLYAATSGGLGVFDPGTREWAAIVPSAGALGSGDVRAVAVALDGTAYFGTAEGVFRLDTHGVFTGYHSGNGLQSNDVIGLALPGDGRLLVGTSVGLAIGTPAGGELNFSLAGAADGLPGRAVRDIVIAVDGQIWVRSDDGVAILAN
jgi:ligand-binding sensor domain-containing protein